MQRFCLQVCAQNFLKNRLSHHEKYFVLFCNELASDIEDEETVNSFRRTLSNVIRTIFLLGSYFFVKLHQQQKQTIRPFLIPCKQDHIC